MSCAVTRRSCGEYLDNCKVTGGIGCGQRNIPRNRRNSGGFTVCKDSTRISRLCACQGNILILSLAAQQVKGLLPVINRLT